jgi:PiT family inorganic phosphate transporter
MTDVYLLALGIFAGAYMAWNIGANDVANSMASSVGAKAITLRQALVLATILTFLGSSLVGSHVAQTIRKGIVYSEIIGDPKIVLLGLLAALLSASLWVCLATYQNLPVSTTHSIVGAMIGFGVVAGGLSAVNWKQVLFIVLSWVLSPVLTASAAFLIFRFIDRTVLSRMDSSGGLVRTTPILIASTLCVMSLSLFLDTPLGTKLHLSVPGAFAASAGVGLASYLTCVFVIARLLSERQEAFKSGNDIFRYLQIMTACYVAFGSGANDVANAMGPLAGVYFIYSTGTTAETSPIPVGMLAFGGAMICVGICTWGYRVIETVGSKITELDNIRGFTVEFSAATMILVASMLGLPVSTTHAAVGAYIGVGLARGLAALDLGVLWKIMLYWVITVPVSAVTCAIIYLLLSLIFM